MKCVLGIDTSCYTTSVALAGREGLLADERRPLKVKPGGRGLRQSEAVFQHTQNLPELMEKIFDTRTDADIIGVCASVRPRDRDDSYMPVFLSGEGAARIVAAARGVVLIPTSHQQGHVRAALYQTALTPGPFLGFHLSGGTTELFRSDFSLNVELLGGTEDISAGQLVDRVGVRLGLDFPAGRALEALALRGESRSLIPTSVNGGAVHFSGAEAQAMRFIDGGARAEDAAAEVFSAIARAIAKQAAWAIERTGIRRILLAGGVASSMLLRRELEGRLKKLGVDAQLHWAISELASDNAAGVALIGWDLLNENAEGFK